MRKCLRVTVGFYVKTVQNHADSRFTVKSRKGSVSNSENPGYWKEEPESAVQKQTELRETGNTSEETWTKLGLSPLFLHSEHSWKYQNTAW